MGAGIHAAVKARTLAVGLRAIEEEPRAIIHRVVGRVGYPLEPPNCSDVAKTRKKGDRLLSENPSRVDQKPRRSLIREIDDGWMQDSAIPRGVRNEDRSWVGVSVTGRRHIALGQIELARTCVPCVDKMLS